VKEAGMARKRKPRVLLSFVGSNDAGGLRGKPDGAVLTAVQATRPDEIHLVWNDSTSGDLPFSQIANYLKDQLKQRFKINSVNLHELQLADVTDHNEIYPKLLSLCRDIIHGGKSYTGAIASGTPAMQVCWILMAESGDFPIDLIRSNEPKFGKPLVTPVKLGTGLPRILHLEAERKKLQESNLDLIPKLILDLTNGLVSIGNTTIQLSPVEFCYYRYFVERRLDTDDFVRISGIFVPQEFVEKTMQYRNESYPDKKLSETELKAFLKHGITTTTFRSNVSKTNVKIHGALKNDGLARMFEVAIEGKKNSKMYGIRAPRSKVSLKRSN
jgi:hypothetical protein